MVSKSIADLSIEAETGMRIIAIKRGKRWIYDPEGSTFLKAGDVIIVRGTESGSEILRSYASGEAKMAGLSGPRRRSEMDELDLMLLELKDTSELMIDLAYSSLLYNNREIAEEVFQMEEALDEMATEIQKEGHRTGGQGRRPGQGICGDQTRPVR